MRVPSHSSHRSVAHTLPNGENSDLSVSDLCLFPQDGPGKGAGACFRDTLPNVKHLTFDWLREDPINNWVSPRVEVLPSQRNFLVRSETCGIVLHEPVVTSRDKDH
jgi:hypothetical protein